MIDVFNEVKNLMNFDSEDDFYFLQILQRKKENPQLSSNSRVIKNYYIGSVDYLEDRYDEIKSLCEKFNARAMLRLNKRSYRKVAFKTMQNIANSMANSDYSHIKNSYNRACGNGHNDKNKTWIIDLDDVIDDEYLLKIKKIINESNPEGNKIVCELPTKNGIHLITKPFDLRNFKKIYSDIDIHKDNPINLFIP